MELSGKALKDFWIWYLLPEQQKEYKTSSIIKYASENGAKVRFLAMSFAERYGVFVDFFDSVGLVIDIQPCSCHKPTIFNVNIIKPMMDFIEIDEKKNRQEARISAIKKVNEIYNLQL